MDIFQKETRHKHRFNYPMLATKLEVSTEGRGTTEEVLLDV